MVEKAFRTLLVLGAIVLGTFAAFGQLAAQTPPPETSVEQSQDPPATEPPAEVPAEVPAPTVTPTEVVVDTLVPSPTVAATEPSTDPTGQAPIDASPTLEPSPTPTVAEPEAKIVEIQFSPIDPVSSPAVSTGVITISYANAPIAAEWHIVLSFGDFSGIGNDDAVPAATLSLLGVTGAETASETFDGGVLTLSFSLDSAPPSQGTLVVTVQLSIPDAFGATSYESQLVVSIAQDRTT